MSDLYATGQQGSKPAQYQDPRAQADAAAAAQAGITTPRQIMAARNAREARKAQQQAQTTDTSRRRQQQQEGVAGGGLDLRRPDARNPMDYAAAEAMARLPAGQNVTIGGRTDPVPTTNGIGARAGNTVQNQSQPRPGAGQQSYQYQQPQTTQPSGDASRIQRNRTEAYEKLEMPAVAGARVVPPSMETGTAVKSAFPHAFERWETLSSHWEGLTSYWIRRLQENTNELDNKPIDKQMARQITDLSAAGANLFHAVVELQRLRASSERKFQRWFFENREEQEKSREEVADLQRQLQAAKQNHSQPQQPQISNVASETLQAEKRKADELVREMRRELQISKEEARRAWEELGRREQEERERTIALRSGEPTLIGGVQVLPMQGLSSRHNTSASQRPVTRDGPYAGGPTANMMGGQQPVSRSQTTLESPTQEQQQFQYQPDATSPTDTDPFTETAPRTNPLLPSLRHEPDTQFLHTGSPQPRQPVTSAQAMAAARAVASPSSQRSTQNRSEGPSYIPSTQGGSIQSEEEYHIGPDGQYLRDPQGRPIPYRQPIGGYEEVDSDDEDHTADVEQERLLAQRYAQRQQQSRLTPQQAQTPSRSPQQFASAAYQATTTTPQYESPASQHTTSTISPVTPQQQFHAHPTTTASPGPEADYEGAGYDPPPPDPTSGQSTGQRHHVPTRLSDIIEERTEPSRSSALSATPTTDSTQGGILGTRR